MAVARWLGGAAGVAGGHSRRRYAAAAGRRGAAPVLRLVRRGPRAARSSSTSATATGTSTCTRCNPLLLAGLLRALEPTGVPVMLLHNYPYRRRGRLPSAGLSARVRGPRGSPRTMWARGPPRCSARRLSWCRCGSSCSLPTPSGCLSSITSARCLFRRALSAFLSSARRRRYELRRRGAHHPPHRRRECPRGLPAGLALSATRPIR